MARPVHENGSRLMVFAQKLLAHGPQPKNPGNFKLRESPAESGVYLKEIKAEDKKWA